MWRISLLLPLFLLSFLLSTCKDMGTEPLGDGRIILGESIEGIHLGDTPERVMELLGPPQYTGHGTASDREWGIFYYDQPTGAEESAIEIWFIGATSTEPGMADAVAVNYGYTGRSREGIGIGTKREDLYRVLGQPRLILGAPTDVSFHYFCVKKTSMLFHIRADTVSVLLLGPLIPDQWATPCE